MPSKYYELYGHYSNSDDAAYLEPAKIRRYPPITYYWTGLLMLDNSYLVGNLTNSKITETKASEPLKF